MPASFPQITQQTGNALSIRATGFIAAMPSREKNGNVG
jgi:hypothetical protein